MITTIESNLRKQPTSFTKAKFYAPSMAW